MKTRFKHYLKNSLIFAGVARYDHDEEEAKEHLLDWMRKAQL